MVGDLKVKRISLYIIILFISSLIDVTTYASDLSPKFITMSNNDDISGGKVTWQKAKKELDKRYKYKDSLFKKLLHDGNTCKLESNYLLHVCITQNRVYSLYKYYADKLNEDYLNHNIADFYILSEEDYNNKLSAYFDLFNGVYNRRELVADSGFNTKEDMFRFSNFGLYTISEGGVCSGIVANNKNIYRCIYGINYVKLYNYIFRHMENYNKYKEQIDIMLGGKDNYFYKNYLKYQDELFKKLKKRELIYYKIGMEPPNLNLEVLKELITNIDLPVSNNNDTLDDILNNLDIKMNNISEEDAYSYNDYYFAKRHIIEIEKEISVLYDKIVNLVTTDFYYYGFDSKKPVDFDITFPHLLSEVPKSIRIKGKFRNMSGAIEMRNLENKYEYELIKDIASNQLHMSVLNAQTRTDMMDIDYFATYRYVMSIDTFNKLIDYMMDGKLVQVNIEGKNAHSVLGYKLEKNKTGDVYYLSVADSNYPCNASDNNKDNITEIKFYLSKKDKDKNEEYEQKVDKYDKVYSLYMVTDKGDRYIDNIWFYTEDDKLIY